MRRVMRNVVCIISGGFEMGDEVGSSCWTGRMDGWDEMVSKQSGRGGGWWMDGMGWVSNESGCSSNRDVRRGGLAICRQDTLALGW